MPTKPGGGPSSGTSQRMEHLVDAGDAAPGDPPPPHTHMRARAASPSLAKAQTELAISWGEHVSTRLDCASPIVVSTFLPGSYSSVAMAQTCGTPRARRGSQGAHPSSTRADPAMAPGRCSRARSCHAGPDHDSPAAHRVGQVLPGERLLQMLVLQPPVRLPADLHQDWLQGGGVGSHVSRHTGPRLVPCPPASAGTREPFRGAGKQRPRCGAAHAQRRHSPCACPGRGRSP